MTRQAVSHAGRAVPARYTSATAGLLIAPAARLGRVSGQAGAAHAQRRPPCQASARAQKSLRSVGRLHDLEVGLAEASPHEMCPNRIVRSRPTSPERAPFKPAPLRAFSNPLNYRAFNIRTKMAVVRLLRRKWAERDGNGPKWAYRAGPRGSDNWPGRPHSAGFRPPTGAEKECLDWATWRRERSCRQTLSAWDFKGLE